MSNTQEMTPDEDLYWRLHGLSKILEGSGVIDESRNHDAYPTILDAMAFIRGSQPVVREPLACEWTHNEDDGFWDTECGQSWRFDDGGPKENHMNFCHSCGKPLRIKGGQHGAE